MCRLIRGSTVIQLLVSLVIMIFLYSVVCTVSITTGLSVITVRDKSVKNNCLAVQNKLLA